MKSILIVSALATISSTAAADFVITKTNKKIVCYGEDNVSIEMNAAKTSIKYTMDGKTLGAKRIIHIDTDDTSYGVYSTSELSLTISNQGDSFIYEGYESPTEVKCR